LYLEEKMKNLFWVGLTAFRLSCFFPESTPLWAAPASAGETTDISTETRSVASLREAVELALANNPQLKALAHSVAANREKIGIAGSYRLPKISIEERVMRTNNPTYGFMAKLNQQRFTAQDFAIDALNYPDPITDFQTAVSLAMPLFVPKISIGHTMAKTEAEARTKELGRKREEMALQVSRTYLMTTTAGKFAAVAKQALDDAREHQRIAQLLYDNEMGIYSDILQAATAVNKAEQQLITANNNAEIARRSLGLILGLPQEADTLAGTGEDLDLKDIDYYLHAAEDRLDMQANKLRHQNAENNLKLAKSNLMPNLALGSSYQFNDHQSPFGSGGESWQIAGSLTWDIFDGMKRRHEINKAAYQVNEVEEYLNSLRRDIDFKIHEAYLKVREAAQNGLLAQSALRTATEGVQLVTARYENSLTLLVALLDAQTSLDQARANLIASATARQLAIIALNYESGTILHDLGIEQSRPRPEEAR
jgi:outer membrane protein TolC